MGDGGVAAPAPHAAARVDADHIARSEHARARDPVHHLVVDRDAAGRRKGHLSWHALEQSDRVVLGKEPVDRLIDLPRRHARLDHRRSHLMRAPNHETSPPHQGNFTSGTKIHHASSTHEGGSQYNSSTKTTASYRIIPTDRRAASDPFTALALVVRPHQRPLPALANRFTASFTRPKISSAVPRPSTQASLPCRP